MATYTYDPKRVDLIVSGHLISGLADGDSISLEPNADAVTTKVGNQGDVVRSRMADRTYTLTIRLLGESPSNTILAALHKTDTETNAPFTVILRNTLGTEVASAATAYVIKRPSLAWGAESGQKEWAIMLTDVEVFEGGAA